MTIDPRQEVRWLLDRMTAAVNSPDMAPEARQAAIRDFTHQLAAQVKTPCMPSLEVPVPFFDERGHMWIA
jgi:hypothetical protein